MILATTADFDHIYYNMYHGCTSLKEIHWNRELADKEDYYIWWEMPGAPRFGAPASTKVIFDL